MASSGGTALTIGETDWARIQRSVLETMSDGVYFVDRQRRILGWNKAAEQLSGYSAEQVLGTSCADNLLMHCDDRGRCLCRDGCPLAATMDDGENREAHVFLHHADGHRVPVHVRATPMYGADGGIIGCIEVFTDDTERVELIDRLRRSQRAALMDALTGLPNRRFFEGALEASLADHARYDLPFGLLLLDIDHFKRFNDAHGHAVGDRALQLVSRTLSRSCLGSDTPARWGGEEFALICWRDTPEQLHDAGERFRSLVAESVLKHEGLKLSVTASVGAAFVRPGDTPESLLERADAFLYESKRAGRNCVTTCLAA